MAEFGARGLEGASTRCIAAAARTPLSAITYHFGGKSGLYLAAADRAALAVRADLLPSGLEDRSGSDPRLARAAALGLLDALFDLMARDDDAAAFIARELSMPGAAFDRLWAGAIGAFVERLAELVRIATGVPDDAARIVTLTLIGQVHVVRGARATMLRLCGPDALDPAELPRLRAMLAANADAIIRRARPPSEAAPRSLSTSGSLPVRDEPPPRLDPERFENTA